MLSFFKKRTKPTKSEAEPNADLGHFIRQTHRPENAPLHHFHATRVLIVSLILSGVANLGLIAVLALTMPWRTTVPYLLQLRPHTDQVVSVEPMEGNTDTAQLLVESLVRRYIHERNAVIPIPRLLNQRWNSTESFVLAHSSQPVFDSFSAEATEILKQIEQQPFQRDITVHTTIHADEWLWHVEFETRDHLGGLAPSNVHSRRWTAYMQLSPIRYETKPTKKQLVRNPLGLVVIAYSVSQINNADSDTARSS